MDHIIYQRIRTNNQKLESIRDILTEHLTQLHSKESTQELTEALEYCLERVKSDIDWIKVVDKLCNIPN